jgi:hypothetical protein
LVGEVVADLSGDKYRVLYECGADLRYLSTVYDAKLLDDGDPEPTPLHTTKWFASTELAGFSLYEFATAALADLVLL